MRTELIPSVDQDHRPGSKLAGEEGFRDDRRIRGSTSGQLRGEVALDRAARVLGAPRGGDRPELEKERDRICALDQAAKGPSHPRRLAAARPTDDDLPPGAEQVVRGDG